MRSRLGHRGLSIQWPAISGVGMAAAQMKDSTNLGSFEDVASELMTGEEVEEALTRLIGSSLKLNGRVVTLLSDQYLQSLNKRVGHQFEGLLHMCVMCMVCLMCIMCMMYMVYDACDVYHV